MTFLLHKLLLPSTDANVANFRHYSLRHLIIGERLPGTRVLQLDVSGRRMECRMTTQCLHDEYFFLQMDGRVKSGHRRFVDALRAALLLRDQFPHHDVKVRATQAITETAQVMH